MALEVGSRCPFSVACVWSLFPDRPWWRGEGGFRDPRRLLLLAFKPVLFMVSPHLRRAVVTPHGGGSRYSCWRFGGVWFVFNWELLSGWPIGGLLRHPTGPKGCRAAAPPLQRLCLMDLSALRSKWCVPGGAVVDHLHDRHRSGGGRAWT
jgi:hypothetical protein